MAQPRRPAPERIDRAPAPAQATVEQLPVVKSTSVIARIAARYAVDADKLMATLKNTVFKPQKLKDGTFREVSNEELMSLLVIADSYKLNPFTREIYAFYDSQRNCIVPIVPIDGWIRMINDHPMYAGMELAYGDFDKPRDDEDADPFVECTIWRKDRDRPIVVREYMRECWRDTIPWGSHPRRMLRHKAIMQCARVAFGFSGVSDPDEAERWVNLPQEEVTVSSSRKPATRAPQAKEPATQLEQRPSHNPLEGAAPASTGEINEAELARMREADRALAEAEAAAGNG
jgi:phage recombination protein Bet